jgi:hypothetical protein
MALLAQKLSPGIAFTKGGQKLRMNPMANFTQVTRFFWRKRAAVFD